MASTEGAHAYFPPGAARQLGEVVGRKVRGHERPARLGAGRGLGGLFEPIPAGAGGGSSAGSSHDVSTGPDSAVTYTCTRGCAFCHDGDFPAMQRG